MTFVLGAGKEATAVLAHAADAERIILPTSTLTLLADSEATGGVLSAISSTLTTGGDGAVPHRHEHSSEVFYVVRGSVDVLAGSDILTASPGDLVVVPPGMPHAFGASSGAEAELLVLISPGVQRFDYFRLLQRVIGGEEPRDVLLEAQEQYDTFFLDSDLWRTFRTRGRSEA